MNIAVVQGTVKGELDRRSGRDGEVLVAFDVAVAVRDGPGQRVPITWAGPEGKVPAIENGVVVTIVGHVHRRFYQAAGRTTSRTDVRAERIVRGAGSRAAKAVASAFEEHNTQAT